MIDDNNLYGYGKLPPKTKAFVIKLMKKDVYIKYTLRSLGEWLKYLEARTKNNLPVEIKNELFCLIFGEGEEE